MCCGEAFSDPRGEGAENPNICAACSRMVDTEEEQERIDRLQAAKEFSHVFDSTVQPQNAS
jgi:hypothetical protein